MSQKGIESGSYKWWETRGLLFCPRFTVDSEVKPESKVVIHETSAPGPLRIGRALNNTLRKTMVRDERTCGEIIVWVPGCRHASISTQSIVERINLVEDRENHKSRCWSCSTARDAVDQTGKYKGNIIQKSKKKRSSLWIYYTPDWYPTHQLVWYLPRDVEYPCTSSCYKPWS